ncbi:MAG: hypothetical protein EZS28_007101 [Streblomastix strix]|uniref:Uncharacterized protein n=1 Tax=Streblomastix strix TaxID=222440 RepID=A0A5J4WR19_9EUKA|nr:MAG: hypothetical protein EZS28_007101 [Streblomastix strix]
MDVTPGRNHPFVRFTYNVGFESIQSFQKVLISSILSFSKVLISFSLFKLSLLFRAALSEILFVSTIVLSKDC